MTPDEVKTQINLILTELLQIITRQLPAVAKEKAIEQARNQISKIVDEFTSEKDYKIVIKKK